MKVAFLPQRGVIAVSGQDKESFLQAIVTNDMRLVSAGASIYSCLLTPQGKYLADFFVTAETPETWLLDIDKSLIADTLKCLAMYKLRSKVMLADVSNEYKIYAFEGASNELPNIELQKFIKDNRIQYGGWRLITKQDIDLNKYESFDYEQWRIENGLGDIPDFERERSTMAELNMDRLGAISWDKGCYVGQELTARVNYRGLAKKRLMPVRLEQEIIIPFDTTLKIEEKTVGYTRSQYQNYVLALVQLQDLQKGNVVSLAETKAEIIFPAWYESEK